MSEVKSLNLSILTTAEGAKLLRMSPASLRGMATAGVIPAFRVGPRWRYRRQDLLDWVEQEATRNRIYKPDIEPRTTGDTDTR